MQEEQYLQEVLNALDNAIANSTKLIDASLKKIEYIQQNIQDERYGMDAEELASHWLIVDEEDEKLNRMEAIKQKLIRQRNNPYFARIDFAEKNCDSKSFYIGIGAVFKQNDLLVVDWRAPVSSMFYDFDKGSAFYNAPQGKIEGEISLKRQYKIENSILKYYFDSDIKIDDEILQQELAKNANTKMKNIVATIQKAQNQIIRNEDFDVVIVQGVAGSGKTSIALHRVAYLLYKYRETLKSEDILIISPNNIFSSYINGVLPELCENNISQISYDNFLRGELEGRVNFSSYEEMVERVLTNENEEFVGLVAYKEGFEFAQNLQIYLSLFAENCFNARQLKFLNLVIDKNELDKLFYHSYKNKPIYLRIQWISEFILDKLDMSQQKQELVLPRLKEVLYSMLKTCDILTIYEDFLYSIGIPFKRENVGFEDATALVYIKNQIFGMHLQMNVKHLLIDEMQDYSPLSFMLFNEVYKCKKTVLGDINQCLYKDLDENYLNLLKSLFVNCGLVNLNKGYRSTVQISQFAQNIIGRHFENVLRNGDEVEIIMAEDYKKQLLEKIEILSSKFESIAIIAPTKSLCDKLYMFLGDIEELNYVDGKSDMLAKINLIPLCFAKGLEFDAVIAVMNTPTNKLEKNALYLSSTRALHKLIVFSSII